MVVCCDVSRREAARSSILENICTAAVVTKRISASGLEYTSLSLDHIETGTAGGVIWYPLVVASRDVENKIHDLIVGTSCRVY